MKNNLLKKYQDRLTVKNSQYFKFVKEKQMSKDGKIDIDIQAEIDSVMSKYKKDNKIKFLK